MTYKFLPEAEEELLEAALYYESEAPGVGIAFTAEVHKAISQKISHPLSVPLLRGTIRKKLVSHYPFTIFYSIEDDLVVIISLAHQKRKPHYWRKRTRRSKG